MSMLIRERATGRIVFDNAQSLALTATGMQGIGFTAPQITSVTHEVIEAELPALFILGESLFNGGVWNHPSDAQARLDAKNEAVFEATKASIFKAVLERLDAFARTRNYISCLSCCTYASSGNLQFSAEGTYMMAARDATWAACYDILDDVVAELRPVPASYADIEAELPALAWPA